MDSRRYLTRKEARGYDGLGAKYKNIEEMWAQELENKQTHGKTLWYQQANHYWSALDPSIESVLGGIEAINEPDIRESSVFLDSLIDQMRLTSDWALDCGAGIGRVTKLLLAPRFANIDLVEQCENFVNFAREFVETDKVRGFYVSGVQDFAVATAKYDLIWVQWVLSQLVEEDLVNFLQVAVRGLKLGGLIVVKENIKTKGFVVHKDDFSVTRNEKMLKHYFALTGLRLVREQLQQKWPENLLRIKMFALVPN